jgi:hypothetical protein
MPKLVERGARMSNARWLLQLQLVLQKTAKLTLPLPEASLVESSGPLAALHYTAYRAIQARHELLNGKVRAVSACSCLLVVCPQVDLKRLETIGVKRLHQPCHCGRDQEKPKSYAVARGNDLRRSVQSNCIHEQYWLVAA